MHFPPQVQAGRGAERYVSPEARRASFENREIKTIAAHSTRIGATDALAKAGTDVLQHQQDGGWKPPQMLQPICAASAPVRAASRGGIEHAPPVGFR